MLPISTGSTRILVIGDSISCGYSDGSERIPRGCLDAYPFKMRERLAQSVPVAIDLVAFPGISLVSSEDPGSPAGMEQKFSHVCTVD